MNRNKIAALFASRRFWIAVLGVVTVAAEDTLGLDPEQVMTAGGIVIAWILGDTVRKTE